MAGLPGLTRRRKSSIKKDFSEQELEELKTAFSLLDRNQDGRVTPGEFKIMLNNLGIEIKYEKAEEIIKNASHSGTGIIDQNDFLTFIKQIQQPPSTTATSKTKSPGGSTTSEVAASSDLQDDLTAAFRVFDLDGDGYITRDELKVAMEMIGEQITDEQIDEVIVMADTDHDERISIEEFIKLLSS